MKTSRNYQCLRYIRHTPSDFSKLFLVQFLAWKTRQDDWKTCAIPCNRTVENLFLPFAYHKAKCIFSVYSLRVEEILVEGYDNTFSTIFFFRVFHSFIHFFSLFLIRIKNSSTKRRKKLINHEHIIK